MRDEMAVAGGVNNLPWLFLATLSVMLVANPLFSLLVSRYRREEFLVTTYRFFAANLVFFFLLFKAMSSTNSIWLGRIFFVWTSVFNLFVVSVFWAFMADVFSTAQGKRLFGFIAFGGSFGAVCGSMITAVMAPYVGTANLILVTILLLEICVQAVRRISRKNRQQLLASGSTQDGGESPALDPARGWIDVTDEKQNLKNTFRDVLAGIRRLAQSPYLMGIAGYIFLFTLTATLLYFQQAEIVSQSFDERIDRTVFFARLDLAVNILTVLIQIFLTGRILSWLGVWPTLSILPFTCVVGFTLLGLRNTLAILAIFQVFRRTANFALSRPAREILFTVVDRQDKYKSKNLIDTFIYRMGDQAGAWSYAGLAVLGVTTAGISLSAVPVVVSWVLLAIWLGKRQEKLREESRQAKNSINRELNREPS
jgi:AAA family ATP:ADP antiporter